MPIIETFNYESRLTAYLNGLTRERVRPFIHLHPNHPLAKQMLLRNEFYAKILICTVVGQEPKLQSFMLLTDDVEAMYQNGLYLYNKWREMGIDKAVFNYCQMMNRLFARIPYSQKEAAGESFPDLCNFEYEIRIFIHGLFNKNPDNSKINPKKREVDRFLALNA